ILELLDYSPESHSLNWCGSMDERERELFDSTSPCGELGPAFVLDETVRGVCVAPTQGRQIDHICVRLTIFMPTVVRSCAESTENVESLFYQILRKAGRKRDGNTNFMADR
ncbi:hypothetical protein B296_00005912, partial [Ensete ventricosum]